MFDPRDVGRRIAAARRAKMLTQVEFAVLLDVSPSTIARWEAGKLPPVREILRAAESLDVPAEWLVEQPEAESGLAQRLERIEAELGVVRRLLQALLDRPPS